MSNPREDAMTVSEMVKLVRPLISSMLVIHHKKTKYERHEVNGEIECWPIDDGCIVDCPGCKQLAERDSVLKVIDEILTSDQLQCNAIVAQKIADDSWLCEDSYKWFVKGYSYAMTQTRAIPALAEVNPELLFFAVSAIIRGAYRFGEALPKQAGTFGCDSH